MAGSDRRTRRTRFVCISDTHNCTVKLPKGDVLIHCGDLTNQGSITELTKQVRWLEAADFECKIVVAGNHDLMLDTAFYNAFGAQRFNNNANNSPQVLADCQTLLTHSASLKYLLHESRTIKLTSPAGPRTTFSIFGSPYSPAWGGDWAFQYPRAGDDGNENGNGNGNDNSKTAQSLWGDIPLDADIVITHGPARTHLDEARSREFAGCEVLRRELWRVRPRLALCGHIHEARGVERVRWDLESRGVEVERTRWTDPNPPESGKIALVDLSAKGGDPLDNDGSRCLADEKARGEWCDRHKGRVGLLRHNDDDDGGGSDERKEEGANIAYPNAGTLGLDEDPDSTHRDRAALAGRLGRRETCFVNCAIQSSSYPHAGRGPRRLNKPIVVDLDLPICEDEEAPAIAECITRMSAS